MSEPPANPSDLPSSPPPPQPATTSVPGPVPNPMAAVEGRAQAPQQGVFGTNMPGWVPFMVVVVGFVLLWTGLRKRHKTLARGEQELLAAAGAVRQLPRPPLNSRPSVGHSAQDGHDLRAAAEEAIARLDDKAAVLQRLIREADTRIARLERGSHSTGARFEATEERERGESPADLAHDPMVREIYALADQGLNNTQIAKRLGQHQGHVGLVLALRR
ncbi:MAG: hypothetical protein ACT4PL_03500 [Phycisphaerales bacterium]